MLRAHTHKMLRAHRRCVQVSCRSMSHLRGLPDGRLSHKMPHADYDEQGNRKRRKMPHPTTVWEDYDERNMLPNFIKTSPMALSGAFWHTIYAAVLITPHQIFHQSDNVKEMLAVNAENLHLPWTELVTYLEPFVQYHDMVSGQLLSAFGIYSTALFLLVSMRTTGALTYQRDGHAAYTGLVTEVVKFSQKAQLYCTDKRVAVDLSLWAYATARAAEMHLQNVRDQAALRPVFESVLLQTRSEVMKKGEHTAEEEAEAAAATERVVGALVAAPNPPLFALQRVTTICHDAFDRAVITNIRALIDIHGSVGAMTGAYQRCAQLQAQPEPYSYTVAMKFFLQLWVANLPLVLVPSLHLCAVPMSTALSFFVYKLDEISAELQNPYGHDASDIALGTINDRLQHDMAQMLLAYDPEHALNAPSADFPIEKHTNEDNALGDPGAGDWADNEKLVKRVGLGNLEENTKKAE